jgi:RNA polymerase sigma-70 factor, ECF subfamily
LWCYQPIVTPPIESSRSALDCQRAAPDPADQLDRLLVSLVADGNREALAKLYVRHGRVLLAQIRLLLADRGMSEEVLQDTILAVWNGAREFRGDSRVLSWMISIARRRTRDRLRRRRVVHLNDDILVEQPDRGFGPESLALARVEVSAVASALKALRPAHREVLGLVLGANLPLEDVARVLEIPTGTVKSRLSAARAALSSQLRKEGYAR